MKALSFFIILVLACTYCVSCGEKKSSPEIGKIQQDTLSSMEIAHIDYICPMDCEKGKVYLEMGKCPVCKMDLIKKEHSEHDGHDHDHNAEHEHKEGDGHEHNEGDGHIHKEGEDEHH